ncbi:MAG: NAD-dependent epimerase/dehydratase family protein [Candidatus Micrarchaeaceae archaeon]|jgi:nucleoside-diphosphate-sugar epimerase
MILVTGGAGHLGKHLVQELVKNGETVRVLSKEETEIKGVEVVVGDILDKITVKKAVEGADTIYHLAAMVDYNPVPKKLMYDVNVNGTKNLLEFSKADKFIFQSTTSVYGKKMKHNPANEKTPCNPSSHYGKTKEIAEKLVLDKDGIVLRAPVIYGPGFNDGFQFVLSQIEKGKMRLIGTGDNMIQWIHVDDLVQALVLAKDKGKKGEIYLVAGRDTKTQRELFALLANDLKVAKPTKKISPALATFMAHYKTISSKLKGKSSKLTAEHISRITSNRLFNISKAEKELGFNPRVNYKHGASEIVEEYIIKRHSK